MEQETIVTNSVWQKSKLLIKIFLIGGLILVLLIPSFFVQELVKEREARQREAFQEVSGRWAGGQTITGPVLVLPYREEIVTSKGLTTVRKNAYVLPEKLNIVSTVKPERRYRGIYEVLLYSSVNQVSGKFAPLPLAQLKLDPSLIYWDEVHLLLGLQDPKGLKDEIQFRWNDSIVAFHPISASNQLMKDGFSSLVAATADKEMNFSATVNLNGSGELLFSPVGKETQVRLTSNWPDPSFIGSTLPDHSVNDSGFVATWKNFAHTRNFPQPGKMKRIRFSHRPSAPASLFPSMVTRKQCAR